MDRKNVDVEPTNRFFIDAYNVWKVLSIIMVFTLGTVYEK